MKYLLSIIILFVYTSILFSQSIIESSADAGKPFYTFTFPETNHKLFLYGSIDRMSKESIYASEFYVINRFRKDTLIFYRALQNCRIEKKNKQALEIIETKKLPFGKGNSWIDCDYIKYSFTEDNISNIIINKTIVLKVPAVDDNIRNYVYDKYEKVIKEKIRLPEDLNYKLLQLSLNGDTKARDILFNMKNKLKLDGVAAEENSDAIEIYNNFVRKK